MSYSTEVLADTPLLYLRLGDPSGTTATDSSGNSRNGTYQNSPTLAVTGLLVGDSDTAVTFNGSDGSGTVANGSWMNATDFTMECWAKWTTTAQCAVAGREDSARAAAIGVTAGKVYFGNLGTTIVQSATGMNNGAAHHLVGIWDNTATTFALYVDGTLAGTSAATSNPTTSTNPFYIAKRGSGDLFFPGTIDEVAYYGSKLSSTRITAHYTAGTTSAAPRLGSVTNRFRTALLRAATR